jgi:glycosyltransferase involved in cell wall biosynthesis
MITVVIPTLNSERTLVPVLAALVPGSANGLVREVILADGGSADETGKIADIAGCHFQKSPHDLGARLRAAAQHARGNWLMFLDPAAMLQEGWMRELRLFTDKAERLGLTEKRAATFKFAYDGYGMKPRLAAAAARLTSLGLPWPEQGLLISKRLYQMLGGHKDGARAERRLISRIGRRRIVTLRATVVIGDGS